MYIFGIEMKFNVVNATSTSLNFPQQNSVLLGNKEIFSERKILSTIRTRKSLKIIFIYSIGMGSHVLYFSYFVEICIKIPVFSENQQMLPLSWFRRTYIV